MSATKGLLRVSPALQRLLGKTEMTGPDAVKEFWAYVKKNQLQSPSDGRVIRPNDQIKSVFGVTDDIHFSQVTKLLHQHLAK